MRVALVTESFYPAVDSATTTVRNVADRLVDTGHEVLVVAPGPGLTSYRGSRVVRVDPLRKPGRQVHEALVSFSPDLVHVTSPATVGRKALKHADRLGLRTLTVQQAAVGDLAAEQWRRTVAARSDRVLVTCEWMQARLAPWGIEASLWTPGVDVAGFGPQLRDTWLHARWSRARSPQGPQVVVGYVGSLHKRNGVRRLAEVATVPGVRLVVIGAGPQEGWLRARLPEAKFVGSLERGELATALATLDVLVHPGTGETDCHVLREAAASGVPVVAPASGGAPDVVRHRETGLLYDPAEGEGLRRAVGVLVRDPRRREVLGRAARAAVTSRGWEDAADELVERWYALASAGARGLLSA